jgi:NAD-dependent SIR2 family protein deacetylase
VPCCGQALVKPTTVLFGRSLPEEFYVKSEEDLPTLDLLIVAGTSLVVTPANSLVYRVPEESTMRVVVNTEAVGQELGSDYYNNPKRGFLAQGECNAVFCNSLRNWDG